MFTYEAVDRAGATVRGEVLAGSEDEALRQLQSRELMPVRLAPRAAAAAASARNRAEVLSHIMDTLIDRPLLAPAD